MKTVSRFIVALMGLGVVLTACDQREFDMPPLNQPEYADTATLTIAAFKAKYASVAVTQITDNDVISGIVVANDVSGNFYKELTIMDSTGGLKVAINQGDLYTQFRLGQRVFIECKDLHVGKYGGYMQLGGPYNTGIGQMTWEVAQAHVFRDGWPEPDHALLTPEVVSMNTVTAETNLGKLITLENVFFTTGGTEVCAPAGSDGSTQTVSKTLSSSDFPGKTLVVRLSSASDFANKTLPAGNGNLTGILSVYNNTYQFTPRDSMDFAFVGFGSDYVSQGSGTRSDPYLVGYAYKYQSKGRTAWVKGYIVGALNSGVSKDNPLTGNDGIKWTAPFMNNTLVIAADSLETDWSKCLVVNLPAGSSLRDSVNLNTNPGNLGRLIAVTGSFEPYSGAPGVIVAFGSLNEYWLDESGIEPGTTLFSESFATGLGKFTGVSVSGSQVWVHKTFDGSGYANMSGYANSRNNANEDWLISQAINLSLVSAATVSFSHAINKGLVANMTTNHTLWVSTNYTSGAPSTASWTQVPITTYPTGADWTFVGSGSISLPAAVMGQANVRLAFKYMCSNSESATWEIKDLVVKSSL